MAISKLILNGEVQMDVTSDTVTAGSMLSGTTATKNDGTKATGNIASKSSTDLTVSGATVTAPAGYYANAASKAVATTTHPNPSASITSSTGVVTASHTQGTGYVTGGTTTGTLNLTTQAGKTVTPTETAQTAVASYRWTTGPVSVAAISSTYVGTGITTRSSTDLTASGSIVTAPAGYYSTAATKAVAAGSAFPPAVTITTNPTVTISSTTGIVTATYSGSSSITPTVTAGYVSQGTAGIVSTTGTKTLQLTSKAAATINTSTADQTIASYRWLTGTQTIKSVTTTNLTAENIAEGVTVKVGDANNASRITQVTGTHSGATSYTATISGSGNSSYCYVTYDGTKYYTSGNTFSFKAGDTLTIYCRGNNFYINDDSVSLSSYSYTFTLPIGDIDIQMTYTSSTSNVIGIFTYVRPTEIIEIQSGGSHNVYTAMEVEVPGGTAFTPAVTITKAPTFSMNSSTGVVTASYNGSSSITPAVTSGWISPNTPAVTAGTISTTGTSTYQLTSKAAATYYPSTADQTIASQRWLVGNQTIKSVTTSNLTAENIAEGVVVKVGDSSNASRITQVTGTHVDSNKYTITITSTASYYRCIIYKGVHYYTAGQSFQISAGETIELYCDSSTRFLYINGENVLMPENSYIYTPSGDINADLNKGSTISIYESIIPTGSMSITSNASYNVYGYSAVNVDVNFDIDVEAPYYNAYKTIVLKSNIYSSNTDIVSYFNTISSIKAYQFEDISMSGSFTFPVCTTIGGGGFQHTDYNHCSFCTFDFPEVVSIELYAFKLQSRLTSINAPKATTIGTQAFMSCRSLQTVNFPKVTSIGTGAFLSCDALTTVSFPEALYIYGSAFYCCGNLSSISFPKVISIGMDAFRACYSLTTANFPSATSIGGYAFYQCSNLTTANFPSATTIGSYAFYQCSSLTTANFPNATSIGAYAFYNCSNLSSISFPNTTYIGFSTFYSCIELTVASFSKLSEIHAFTFAYCSNLTTANFASATFVSTAGFRGCINLTTISFPELLIIQQSAFAYCSALTTVNFPKATTISNYAFYYCINLTTASFPNAISITNGAFSSCYHLLSLYLLGSSVVSLTAIGAFLNTPISTYTTSTDGVYGSIFVPASLYSSYLTATNWSVYSDRIVSV